jgi:hypothetical protein
MWKRFLFMFFVPGILLSLSFCSRKEGAGDDDRDLKLWYRQPAVEWVEALPIGNGRLGAMIFGGAEEERIQFNEDTGWSPVWKINFWARFEDGDHALKMINRQLKPVGGKDTEYRGASGQDGRWRSVPLPQSPPKDKIPIPFSPIFRRTHS